MKCMSAWNFIVHLVSWQCSALELLYYIYIYICHSVHSIQMYCSTGSRVHYKPVEWSTIHNNNSTLAARATYVSINLINIELHSFHHLQSISLLFGIPPFPHTNAQTLYLPNQQNTACRVIFGSCYFCPSQLWTFALNYCVSIKKHCKREKFSQC